MSRSEIAIVGGGVAGLVAAMHIGAAGGKAVLFEASPRLGGRAQTRVVEGFASTRGRMRCTSLAPFTRRYGSSA